MNFRHLRGLGGEIPINLPLDEDGYLGRECPDCMGYFKITPGTGLKDATDCTCPYCGHKAHHDHFWTRDQIEYAQSIAQRKVQEALGKDLEEFARAQNRKWGKPKGPLGISVQWETQKSSPVPIHHYREEQLETKVVCDQCTLRYAIYGVFAYCPDCGARNSTQILEANLDLVQKEIDLADSVKQPDLADHLIADALENVVSSFDGFGREVCRVNASKASTPAKVDRVSFQNLAGAQKNVSNLFAFDIASALLPDEWDTAKRCFQKRHLIAHNMGVVDADYIAATNDPDAVIGRKITITKDEILTLSDIVKKLGTYLVRQFAALP